MVSREAAPTPEGRQVSARMRILAEPAERSRPGMSTDRITAAALQIVDTEGSQALTMRRLGQALDRKLMTPYRYVPSKTRCWTASSHRSSPTSPSTPLPLTGGRNCATSPPPSGARARSPQRDTAAGHPAAYQPPRATAASHLAVPGTSSNLLIRVGFSPPAHCPGLSPWRH